MRRTTLLVVLALVALIGLLAACSGTPTATPVPPTATKPPVAPAATNTTAPAAPAATNTTAPAAPAATKPAAAPTAAAAAPTAAAATGSGGPTTGGAKPPSVQLVLMPIAANPADKNVITSTIKTMTDTKAGTYSATVQMGQTGLSNVSIGVPVTLSANNLDPKNAATKWTWALQKPPESKATLVFTNTQSTRFTPDVVGWYKVDLTPAGDAAGTAAPLQSVQIHADTYVGVDKGGCVKCHPGEVAEWQKTGHAIIFSREVSGGADPKTTHYSETCIRCHTTGYYYDSTGKAVANGGFADMQAKTGWKFPTFQEMGEKTKGVWDAVPADLKNVSNIQCEACHGPAGEHVAKGAKTMQGSVDEGVCNVCHNGGGHHIKGTEIQNAKHTEENSAAWTDPTGPSRSACVRCHSADGYISFTQNPTNQAAWAYNAEALTCTACHDPHSEANAMQLRVGAKAVNVPVTLPDTFLSTTCVECHNGRTKAADAQNASFPHYSAAAEVVYGLGGVDYGQTIVNSPHGQMVGAAPLADPADATGKTMLFAGEKPGACVACHMYPGPSDSKDPNYLKVGAHSFNTVSPDGKTDYGASCKSCHGDVKDFNLKAKADYDGNGKVEGVQDEVKGLLNLFVAEFDKAGIKRQDGYPYFTNTATMNEKQKNAMYNFRMVYGVMWTGEGKAAAVHNFKRAVQLLQLSYKDLTGQDVPNATLMK